MVVAVDATNGTIVNAWPRSVTGPVSVVADVVVVQVSTWIVALSLGLKKMWQKRLPGVMCPYGVVGTETRVYVVADEIMYALDLKTGDVLAKSESVGASSYTAPTLSEDASLVYYSTGCAIGALDADTLEAAWYEWYPEDCSSTVMSGAWYPVAAGGAALSSRRSLYSVYYRIFSGIDDWEHVCSYEGWGGPATDSAYVYAPCGGGISVYSLQDDSVVGSLRCYDCYATPLVLRDYALTVSRGDGLLVFRKPYYGEYPVLQLAIPEDSNGATVTHFGALAYRDGWVYVPYTMSDGVRGLTAFRFGDSVPTPTPTKGPPPQPTTSSPTVVPTWVPSTAVPTPVPFTSDDDRRVPTAVIILTVLFWVLMACCCVGLCAACRSLCCVRRRRHYARPPVVEATYAIPELNAFVESEHEIELGSSRDHILPTDADQPDSDKDDDVLADDDDTYVRLADDDKATKPKP